MAAGGGARVLRIDDDVAPLTEDLADPSSVDPDRDFDRTFWKTVAGIAIERVRRRFDADGRADQFRLFEEYDLQAGTERPTYAALAERSGLKEGDVRNRLFAVREAVRAEIRTELAEVTAGERELEEEWNGLFGA